MSNSTGSINVGREIIGKYVGGTKPSPFRSVKGQLQVKGGYPGIKYQLGFFIPLYQRMGWARQSDINITQPDSRGSAQVGSAAQSPNGAGE